MTPATSRETTSYTVQAQSHWRFTDERVNWVKLGVGLLALFMVLFLVVTLSQIAITMPQSAGAGRGAFENSRVLFLILNTAAIGSSVLGMLAIIIGLASIAFTPRPMQAKFFALGAVVLYTLDASQAWPLRHGAGELDASQRIRTLIVQFRMFAEIATGT